MTDLERKLAEALRGQAGEVTPNLDAAWAEQQRRQRRPRRRRLTVVVAPLAAVLVVLTSVLLATQLNTATAPPANPGRELTLAPPRYTPLSQLQMINTPEVLTEFTGQTDTWTTYVFIATVAGSSHFCVAAVPRGDQLVPSAPQYGTKSPSCAPIDDNAEVHAGYVGEVGGPLPAGKAVYLTDQRVFRLKMFNAEGDMSAASKRSEVSGYAASLVDVVPGSPPVRFQIN
ncbi:hypothetical protein [Amycolatopsis kentuckyensis]|uniref:hypothetical protein n=1 Tax=Amycolatopsis kentuckyensis TaxID=218823 RepID=UPI003561AC25